jgi:hypothetical protein
VQGVPCELSAIYPIAAGLSRQCRSMRRNRMNVLPSQWGQIEAEFQKAFAASGIPKYPALAQPPRQKLQ